MQKMNTELYTGVEQRRTKERHTKERRTKERCTKERRTKERRIMEQNTGGRRGTKYRHENGPPKTPHEALCVHNRSKQCARRIETEPEGK